jgi:hypothetical protein
MSGTLKTSLDRQEQYARIRQIEADADQKEQAVTFGAAQLFISFVAAISALTTAIAAAFHWSTGP